MNVWINWILSLFTQTYYYINNRGGGMKISLIK